MLYSLFSSCIIQRLLAAGLHSGAALSVALLLIPYIIWSVCRHPHSIQRQCKFRYKIFVSIVQKSHLFALLENLSLFLR